MPRDKQRPGIPIHIDTGEPRVDDPAAYKNATYWFPANRISTKLTACLESARDISRLLDILARQEHPSRDRRLIKLLSTPLYNLARGVEGVLNDLQGNAKEYGQLDASERSRINERLSDYSNTVPLRDGPLRTIRDKISSHVDHDVFVGDPRKVWGFVNLEQQLAWLKAIIQQWEFLLSLGVYAWTRDSGHPNIFRLMSEDGVQVDLDLKNKAIVNVTLVRSPKYYFYEQMQHIANLVVTLSTKEHS